MQRNEENVFIQLYNKVCCVKRLTSSHSQTSQLSHKVVHIIYVRSYVICVATHMAIHAKITASYHPRGWEETLGTELVYPNCPYLYCGINENPPMMTMETHDCHCLNDRHRKKNSLSHPHQSCLGMKASSLKGRGRQSAFPSTWQQGSVSWRDREVQEHIRRW